MAVVLLSLLCRASRQVSSVLTNWIVMMTLYKWFLQISGKNVFLVEFDDYGLDCYKDIMQMVSSNIGQNALRESPRYWVSMINNFIVKLL